MLGAAAAQVALWPAALLNALAGYALGYVAEVAHACAGSRLAVWSFALPSPAALVAVYAGLVLLLAAPRVGRLVSPGSGRRAVALAAAVGALALAGLIAARAGVPRPPDRFTVTFIDVGQGDATLLQAPDGQAALLDGGPPGSGIVGALRRRGVRELDLVVLTHAQEDHQGGLADVLGEVPVRVLLDGGTGSTDPIHARIAALALERGTRVITGAAGQTLQLGGLKLSVLSPASRPPGERPDPGEDPNLRAIVLIASFEGLRVFLPADAESDVTADLSLPHVDV